MEKFYTHLMDLLEAIDDCASKRRILPCLTLLYSGMDVMASLNPSHKGEMNQARFVRWVDRYLLPDSSIKCGALDIYAARCGVVHTFTPNSKLYRDGKARMIGYAYGTEKAEKLDKASVALGFQDRSVHIGELIKAFRQAVAKHLKDIESDGSLKKRFESATGMWFSHVDSKKMDDFLKIVG
jgi:hypothetical protein